MKIKMIYAVLLAVTAIITTQPALATDTDNIGLEKEANHYSYPAATVTYDQGKWTIFFEGINLEDARGFSWNGESITESLSNAVANGNATLIKVPGGVELHFDADALPFKDDGVLAILLPTGAEVSMYLPFNTIAQADLASKCAFLTMSEPTNTSKVSSCYYGSTNCLKKGYYHTGVDYGYSSKYPSAYSVADGKVVSVITKSSSDHGMGNNVIIEHTISDCSKIYSTYSHLAGIDSKIKNGTSVKRGQKIGTIGGSGYGNSDYYSKHLHLEFKLKAVTGTPNSYSTTCTSGCWGYTPYSPDKYGFKNPGNYIGK